MTEVILHEHILHAGQFSCPDQSMSYDHDVENSYEIRGRGLKQLLGHLDIFSAICCPKLMKLFSRGQMGTCTEMHNFSYIG